jgi:phage head maturation protease
LLSKSRAKWTEGDPLNGLLQKNNSKVRKIYDVSPVTYPAYVDTEVASRSLTAFKEENKRAKIGKQ